MRKLIGLVFITCALVLPVAWWFKDSIGVIDVVPQVLAVPTQNSVAAAPFNVDQGGVTYRVDPQFRYSLNGLVVSRRNHDGNSMLHEMWNDHLNVADLCVIWGDNVTRLDFDAFEFSSGQFTCFVRTRDSVQWARFRMDQLANNHLITEDRYLRDLISDVKIGDQVNVEGYLASYSNGSGFSRGTSTTRTDSGNGACETIYVEDFSVIREMFSIWRVLFDGAWIGLLLTAGTWVVGVGRGAL